MLCLNSETSLTVDTIMAHCIPTSIENDGKVEEKRGHERGHERQAMRNCKKCCTQREMKDNDFF